MLVTVYITSFNRLFLLKRALNSVINQSYRNLEIIVVDDYSTDGTQEFLENIARLDQRIKFFLKEKNGGACESRNIAIHEAQGEYITGLDDDDYFLPNRIENFVKNIESDPKAVLYFDNPLIKQNEEDNIPISKKRKLINKIKPNKVYAKDLLALNYIGNQVFIKTNCLKECGAFDQAMPMWQDLECWYNVLKITKGYAKRLPSYTYVVDISHELERISNLKPEKAKKTYQRFLTKHNLDKNLSKLLFCQFYEYDKDLIQLQPLLKRLTYSFNLFIIMNTLKIFLLYVKNR